MTTSGSSNTDTDPSGLSYEPHSAISSTVTLRANRGVELLSELDTLINQVSTTLGSLREAAEASKRRRELLDACIRANLVEMPDGQFTQMTNDADRCRMLETIFEADHEFADSRLLFHLGFTKAVGGLRFISEQNTMSALNPSLTRN